MALVDYHRYNDLPSLEEADARRQALHIDDMIKGPMRDVFIRYGVQNICSLYLSHRHHQIEEGEAVVKVHGTAHLMGVKDMEDIKAVGNKIVPTTWMGSELLPMEFAVVPASARNPALSPDLCKEIADVLASNGCEGLFGIDTLGEVNWSELSVGNASVVVPSNGNEKEEDYIPVALAFDEHTPGFRVHGKCGTDHKHTSKP